MSGSEQALIKAIFFEGLSEREVGLRLGNPQTIEMIAELVAKLLEMEIDGNRNRHEVEASHSGKYFPDYFR